ncbi:hypothetical protein [Alkalihalobacillus sp. R86527]|uniref:hypothetical protein n=1 Tax=Alkalihalobacillus sp. R86527 TaxID=3093863 RepID=UPI00366FC565
MKTLISRFFGKNKCLICKQKPIRPQYYLDEENVRKPVCYKCVSYAERRAYRKA